MTVPPDLIVKVSRVHIVTAIVNVLKNAYDFLPADSEGPEGKIHVRVMQKAKAVHIVVQDSGQGIPHGQSRRSAPVFARTNRPPPCGYRIRLVQRAPLRGSAWRPLVYRQRRESRHGRHLGLAGRLRYAGMKHRALVVEDDANIAESVIDTLESLGHTYAWVKSQEEARKQIGRRRFHVCAAGPADPRAVSGEAWRASSTASIWRGRFTRRRR